VSGAVVLARSGAAVPVTLERRYVGIAERAPEPERGSWCTAVRVRGRDKSALTRFGTVARSSCGAALLALELDTGRTHQIRIHASRAGAPLLGDRAHGGRVRRVEADGSVRELERIALHAIRVRTGDFEAIAPVPAELVELWESLGGDGADFERALASEVGP
jgi:23S rRNA-/tRNA-specific pseudouridylate synthase